jgi:hypothetical protein
MRKVLNYLLCCLFLSVVGLAQSASPRIILTDLQSGPNTGGRNNQGAIVTVYGFGFGSTQGSSTVTIGGASAASYLQWSDTKISFQPGSSAVSGNIVVNVPGAGASNGMPFTVRSGRIRFVATPRRALIHRAPRWPSPRAERALNRSRSSLIPEPP